MRSRAGFVVAVAGVSALFAAAGAARAIPFSWILPSLAAHESLPPLGSDVGAAVSLALFGMGIVAVLIAGAVVLVPERFEPPTVTVRNELPGLTADTRLLWLAIPIVLVTSAYIVVMTAYLTGLRTNSFLFDPGVLARFSVMSMLPDFGLTILSFTIDRDLRLSAIGIGLVLAILGAITYILLKGIDDKWRGTEFGE